MGSPQGDQTTRELTEQIRRDVQREVEQARAEARAAQEEAREAAADAREAMQEREGMAVPPPPGIPRIRVTRDGRAIVVGGEEEPQLVASTQGPMPHPIPPIPVEAVVISIAFFVMLAVIAIGVPLARAFARRMDRQAAQPAIPRELAEQLLRLEQSVDTIAVEVERISEGQRFSSGLLREMHPMVQRSQIAAPAESPGANGGR
jgi:hypothetical protein